MARSPRSDDRKTPPTGPHDALFQALLADPADAGALIRALLPADVAARLTDDPPHRLDAGFVDAHLRGTRSDRLYAVTLTDTPSALVYVLLEHKSHPDPRTPLQLVGYMVRIWERVLAQKQAPPDRLPPIFPVVVYHGRSPWRIPTSLVETLAADVVVRDALRDLRYTVRDLGHVPVESLPVPPHLRAGLMALCLGTADEAPLDRVVAIVAALPDDSLLERQVITYIVRTIQTLTTADWRRIAALAKPTREDDMVSLAAQEWMAEGLKVGEARGLQIGEARGLQIGEARALRDSVIAVLEARFGPLNSTVRERLDGMPPTDLRPLLTRAATISTVDALFDALPDT